MPTVRLAEPDDAASIGTISVRAWQRAYRGLLPDQYLASLDPVDRGERWRTASEAGQPPGAATLVLVGGVEVRGFVQVCPTRDHDAAPGTGEVASLYVLPEEWGRGYGRRLTSAGRDLLASAGHSRATLWVLAGNRRAIRFYEKAGWTADGATKDAVFGGAQVREARYRVVLGDVRTRC